MKQNILALLLGCLAITVQASEYNTIQTDTSALTFIYTQMGVPMEGRLKKFDAQFSFDPAKPEAANVTLDMDVASLDAGSPEANDEIANKAWFNTSAFPRAKFVSAGFKSLGGNRYEVSGYISIKGHTQPVSAPFTLNKQGNISIIEGALVLKRADFAIGEGAWADFGVIANEIQIKFQFPISVRT